MKNEDNLFEELNNKINELFEALSTEDDDSDILSNTDDLKELDNTISLNDESGEKVPFEFLDLIMYKDEEYLVLLTKDGSDDAGEVVILKVDETDNDDEDAYTSVDDEDTLMAVFEIFKNKFKDAFNFVDE